MPFHPTRSPRAPSLQRGLYSMMLSQSRSHRRRNATTARRPPCDRAKGRISSPARPSAPISSSQTPRRGWSAIEAVKAMLEQRAGEAAKVIEGTAETVALPAPDVVPDGPNKVMDAADTAVGARERKPRKRKAPSPTGG
jgi:hypothetical protein